MPVQALASVLRSHTWRTAENSAAYLLPLLAPGLAVLDVGCGPATITVDLARRVAPGRVVGLDTSAEVIAEATDLAATEQVENTRFVYPLTPGLSRWAELYQRVHRSNGGEPDAGRRLKAWARQAGFRKGSSPG